MKPNIKKLCFAASLTLMLASPSSWATFISFASGSGPDGALSASATFTVSDGKIIVTLTNTLSAALFKSAGQALSDIKFGLSNSPGVLNGSSASGQFGDTSGTPVVVTYVDTDTFTGNATPLRWLGQGPPPSGGSGTFTIDNTANTILMEAIGGGSPSQMISPFVKDGDPYPIGNNGLQQQNSYVIGSASFELDLSGVTANTIITSAIFSFGTGPDTFVTGTIPVPIQETPEPNSLALLGFAGLLLGFIIRRRRVS